MTLALLLMLWWRAADDAAARPPRSPEELRGAAFEVLRDAAQSQGDAASPRLLFELSCAALEAGALREAEIAAEKLVVRGGAGYTRTRDFLRGNAAFRRCEQAEALALRPESGPEALALAVGYARTALRCWQDCLLATSEWPEARRNAERTLWKLAALKRQQELRQLQQRKKQTPRQAPPPPADSPPTAQAPPETPTPEMLRELLELLDEKDRARRELRRARRPSAEVEQDW